MRTISRDSRLFVVSFIVLFAVLGLLSAFVIVGESRRSRILVEYEADSIASSLTEALRSFDGSALPALDQRILGFGLYDANGRLVSGVGDAPAALDRPSAGASFSYDEGKKRLALTRQLGMVGMGGRPARNGNLLRAMRQLMAIAGRGPGFLYLSLDVRDYFRRRDLLGAASVLVPAAIAALAAVFLRLLASNARLRRAAEERETLARLGESARTLVHEIRNPLGAIRIQTGVLRQRLSAAGPPGSAEAPELEAIDEEIDRLTDLSRRVSDFLKNPAGAPRRLELGAFLADLARRSPYGTRYVAGGRDSAVLADPGLLRSAVENLLRNAGESYEGGAGEVELRLGREADRAVISVLDRGKGIPAEAMGKVFDPFYTDKAQGSGIGLPLARRFVEAAGGKLSLAPRRGGGTEARILLPALEEDP